MKIESRKNISVPNPEEGSSAIVDQVTPKPEAFSQNPPKIPLRIFRLSCAIRTVITSSFATAPLFTNSCTPWRTRAPGASPGPEPWPRLARSWPKRPQVKKTLKNWRFYCLWICNFVSFQHLERFSRGSTATKVTQIQVESKKSSRLKWVSKTICEYFMGVFTKYDYEFMYKNVL